MFIYYVLIMMLTYIGPVYAEVGVTPNQPKIENHEVLAQNDVEVGELTSGKIKIFTDKTHTSTIEVDKQDCDIMRKKDNTIALGFKFGGLMWGCGPEIQIGHSSGVRWKSDVQRMVAEYQELCTHFNTGRLSQEEYQESKQAIINRGYNYAREIHERFKKKKDDMFKEMDAGRFISLQNNRFFEGCCVQYQLPVVNSTDRYFARNRNNVDGRVVVSRRERDHWNYMMNSGNIFGRRGGNINWNLRIGGGW